jgi:hypothetical protein
MPPHRDNAALMTAASRGRSISFTGWPPSLPARRERRRTCYIVCGWRGRVKSPAQMGRATVYKVNLHAREMKLSRLWGTQRPAGQFSDRLEIGVGDRRVSGMRRRSLKQWEAHIKRPLNAIRATDHLIA